MVREVTKRVFVTENDNKEFPTQSEAAIHEDTVILTDFLSAQFPDMGAAKLKAIAVSIAERYELTGRAIDGPAG